MATPKKSKTTLKKAPKTRKEQAAKTRARLKEATKTLLERSSYRQMRIVDIATEAKVAVGLFYHYFPDIKTVTSEVLADFMEMLTLEARKSPRGSDLFDTLKVQFEILTGNFEQHPGLMKCMLQVSDEIPEFGEIWKASNRQWTTSFARFLGDCMGDKKPDPDMVMLLAYCLGSMLDGVMHEYYVQRNPDLIGRIKSTKDLAEILAALTYRAVFLKNPPIEKLTISASLVA